MQRQSLAELIAQVSAEFSVPLMEKFKLDRPDATLLERAGLLALVHEMAVNTIILKLLGERRCEVLKRSGDPGRSAHDSYEYRFSDGGQDIAGQELPKPPDEPWFGSGGNYL